jgi:ABC-type antimicrobial peptide transport system permease subunit
MLLRTIGEPEGLAGNVREAVRRVDPQVPVGTLSSLSSILADQLATRRATTHVIDGLAAAALALAALGLYGLLALLVTGPMRETGIRLALGSAPLHEAIRVVRDCLTSTVAGVSCGLALALAAGRLVQNLLVAVSPRDATTLVGVSLTMLAVSICAASFPAWRAARVDPIAVLRGD